MFEFLRNVIAKPLTESDIRTALAQSEALQYLDNISLLPKGKVIVTLAVDPKRGVALEEMRLKAEHIVLAVPNVKQALVILTAEKPQNEIPPNEIPPISPIAPRKNAPLKLNGIKKIIAVSSGKGGVGKSTVAANIAVAMAERGFKIGLMDGDIYGPSVPRLFGLKDTKPEQKEGGIIIPIETHGIKIMSMGFLVSETTPMIWRGPIVQSAITQLLRDVEWGTDENQLDLLIIDMPPGTGDAHLTLAQKVALSGAVIVSTPQDLALIDARKGLEMYRKMDVPILGLIENMSYYCCPECGHKDDVFGHGGARQEAMTLGINFLGEIPLNGAIRKASDRGEMVTEFYKDITDNILESMNDTMQKPFPKIVFE